MHTECHIDSLVVVKLHFFKCTVYILFDRILGWFASYITSVIKSAFSFKTINSSYHRKGELKKGSKYLKASQCQFIYKKCRSPIAQLQSTSMFIIFWDFDGWANFVITTSEKKRDY